MAKGIHKLSSAKAKAATDAGRYSDGGGLYLTITKGGSKSWAYIGPVTENVERWA